MGVKKREEKRYNPIHKRNKVTISVHYYKIRMSVVLRVLYIIYNHVIRDSCLARGRTE